MMPSTPSSGAVVVQFFMVVMLCSGDQTKFLLNSRLLESVITVCGRTKQNLSDPCWHTEMLLYLPASICDLMRGVSVPGHVWCINFGHHWTYYLLSSGF